ncbi:response regulator transcription factor [Acidocella sp.]|uniref:response regulator transcription factor n=1 Tax=Acidocella sp. TaxID=50710 RepID=UPI0026148560|nr:response regulator transcription factor [Acidocella sp.]
MKCFTILLIEDDVRAADFICEALARDGHHVTVAPDGRSGMLQAGGQSWDLLIVDRMLPRIDGVSLVRSLRSARHETPVLFLTALDGIDDRIAGLRAGGDDYLVKPFAIDELRARVYALVRRCAPVVKNKILAVEDLVLDRMAGRVTRAGRSLVLKPREYQLLEFLMLHAGWPVTRTMLLEKVWNIHFDPGTTLIESHVSRLRAKIDEGFGLKLLHTLRGVGYRLGPDDA